MSSRKPLLFFILVAAGVSLILLFVSFRLANGQAGLPDVSGYYWWLNDSVPLTAVSTDLGTPGYTGYASCVDDYCSGVAYPPAAYNASRATVTIGNPGDDAQAYVFDVSYEDRQSSSNYRSWIGNQGIFGWVYPLPATIYRVCVWNSNTVSELSTWASGNCDVSMAYSNPVGGAVLEYESAYDDWASFDWGVSFSFVGVLRDTVEPDPEPSVIDWNYPCTWVVTGTGEIMTGTENLLYNPSFETGSGAPAGWITELPNLWSYVEHDSVGANDGTDYMVYNQYQTLFVGLGRLKQTIDVPIDYVTTTFQVGYKLGDCYVGAACDEEVLLSVGVGSFQSPFLTLSYGTDNCRIYNDELNSQYYICDWNMAEFELDTFPGLYQYRFAVSSNAGMSGAISIDGVSARVTDGYGFACIPPEQSPAFPTPTPDYALPTALPLPTVAPFPTVGSILPTPVNSGIGLTPMATSCAGWSEFGVLSTTVPALNVCLSPQFVDLASNPVNDATGGEYGQWLFYMFSGFVAASVIAYVRFR